MAGERTFEKNGETYTVRFFDANSFYDLKDLREIVQSPGVQQYMTSVRNMSHKHYGKWMNEKGEDDYFLLAITGKDLERQGVERVHGFVYFYPSELIRGMLEISYAKRPGAPAGLISPGVKNAALIVKEVKGDSPRIIAEIEKINEASIGAVEKAGFVKYRNFDRQGNGLWILEWGNVTPS